MDDLPRTRYSAGSATESSLSRLNAETTIALARSNLRLLGATNIEIAKDELFKIAMFQLDTALAKMHAGENQ